MRSKTFQDKVDINTSVKISEISQSILNNTTKIDTTSEVSMLLSDSTVWKNTTLSM